MTTLSLSVSELMLEKIRELLEAGKFRTEEEFARHALAAELRRQAKLELDRLLEAGVASEQVEMSDDDWQALEARALARLDAKSAHRGRAASGASSCVGARCRGPSTST